MSNHADTPMQLSVAGSPSNVQPAAPSAAPTSQYTFTRASTQATRALLSSDDGPGYTTDSQASSNYQDHLAQSKFSPNTTSENQDGTTLVPPSFDHRDLRREMVTEKPLGGAKHKEEGYFSTAT